MKTCRTCNQAKPADAYRGARSMCLACEHTRRREWYAAQDPMLECSVQPRPLSHPLTAYHSAMSKGPLHYTWQDKPHRLVYDLIAAVKHYANQAGQAAPAPVAEDAEDAARWRTAVDTTDPTQGNAA